MPNPHLKQKSPLIIELVGLAGTGKTSIIKALNERYKNFLISPDLQVKKFKHFSLFARDIPSLLPLIIRGVRSSRGFTWDEIKAIVYLDRGQQIIAKLPISENSAILLDHGPIFKLATLHAFGPESLQDQELEPWWQKMFSRWGSILDIIIWLDAPIPILKDRINSRQQKHAIKHSPDEDVFQFLERYRKSYELVLSKLTVNGSPVMIQFDTSQSSIEQIVNELAMTGAL